MVDGISMMNPGVGISGVSTPRTESFSISGQKSTLSPALSVSGNEKGLSTYEGQNVDSIVDSYLIPKSEDPDLMAPHVFARTLSSALDKLADIGKDRNLKNMNDDIQENNEILRMFSSLVVPG